MTEQCSKCKFWFIFDEYASHHEDDQQGTCKRYPPKLDLTEAHWGDDSESYSYLDYRYWNHPVTTGDNWCGEFKQKTETNNI